MAMTVAQVEAWMRAHGVVENVIRDEAEYIARAYADPDEDPLAVLERSLPGYLQRSRSGDTYSTSLPDPAITTIGETTHALITAPFRPVNMDLPPPVVIVPQAPVFRTLTLPGPTLSGVIPPTTTGYTTSPRTWLVAAAAIASVYFAMKG